MAASKTTIERICHLCSTSLNITEYERPFSCDSANHSTICYHCTTLLSQKICLDCSKSLSRNDTLYKQIFVDLRTYYLHSYYKQSGQNKLKLRSDLNRRIKPLKQLITSAKQRNLDDRHSYNACLIIELMKAEEMYAKLHTLRMRLDENNFDLDEVKQNYKMLLHEDCDKYILTCEYLQAIHRTAQNQTLLPSLFSATERMSDLQGGNVIIVSKKFTQLLVCDLTRLGTRDEKRISLRVGLIGATKQGKSSLCNYLRDLYGRSNSNAPDEYANVGAAEITSLCVVSYIHDFVDEDSGQSYTIELKDLPGDLGENTEYFKSLIKTADCDVYLVVRRETEFQKNDINYKDIIKEFGRECLFVQTGTDVAFSQKFAEYNGFDLNISEPDARANFDETLQDLKSSLTSRLKDSKVDETDVFFVGCPLNAPSGMNDTNNYHVLFDLTELKSRLIKMANKYKGLRLKRDVITTASHFIDMNFERNYKISKWQRSIVAGGMSAVPFLDVWYTKSSMKKIQEDFGLNDDFIDYLKELDSEYNITLSNVIPGADGSTKTGIALSTAKSALAIGSAAVRVSSTIKAAAVIGGFALGPLMLPATVGITGVQILVTTFKTKSKLQDYISTIRKCLKDLVELIVTAMLRHFKLL